MKKQQQSINNGITVVYRKNLFQNKSAAMATGGRFEGEQKSIYHSKVYKTNSI